MKPKHVVLGSHVSFAKPDYLLGSAKTAFENKANAMMIYLGAPQNTMRVEPSLYRADEYRKIFGNKIPAENIVVHAPYIVNPASHAKQKFAEEFLISEIKRMQTFGAKYLILHPGSATDLPRPAALNVCLATIEGILRQSEDVTILLETMAGKGKELGITLEEIAFLTHTLNSPRVGVCLDTCHLWDAGYDIKDRANYEAFIDQLSSHNLLDKIKVIHINDSKNHLGSHKDRHENIGKGQIGLEALRRITLDPRFAGAIKILETPFIYPTIYAEEIALLLMA